MQEQEAFQEGKAGRRKQVLRNLDFERAEELFPCG